MTNTHILFITLQELILKGEFLFDSRTPSRFTIEVHIGPLFELIGGDLGLFMPLEPGHVLLMIAP